MGGDLREGVRTSGRRSFNIRQRVNRGEWIDSPEIILASMSDEGFTRVRVGEGRGDARTLDGTSAGGP